MVKWLDFNGTLEILVLTAIVIELFALYNHTKLDNRIDEHVQETNDQLLRSGEIMKALDDHIFKFNENMIRLDGHMEKVNEYMEKMNAQLIRYDEHMNRLDGIIWKSYFQGIEQKISNTQKVKTIFEKREIRNTGI